MRHIAGIVLCLSLAAGAAAQDGKDGKDAKAAKPAPVAVQGKAALAGDMPARAKKIAMKEECHGIHEEDPRDESELVNEANRGVANVFVWVSKGAPAGPHPLPPGGPHEIHQKGCIYRPRVSGMRAGQGLKVMNDDKVEHNVHLKPRKSKEENPMQLPGQSHIFPLNAEVMVDVRCDIHNWMVSFVGVVDHPFFAVTDANGAYKLPPLPPGSYEVGAWHEKYGEKTLKVDVAADMKPVEFTFERPKEK